MDFLPNNEFVHHLAGSEDPTVRRLLRIIYLYEDLVLELKHANGLQEYGDGFYIDDMPVSDYIHSLESTTERMEREIDELSGEIERLSARSLSEFIADISDKLRIAESANTELRITARRAETEKQEALEKLNMWAVLNEDYSHKS